MTNRRSRDGFVVCVEPPDTDELRVVHVADGEVTLSTGEVLVAPYTKLRHLAEAICQEQVAVTVRTWWTPDGDELVELHRKEPL